MSISSYLSEKARKHILQIASFTPPSTLYLSLAQGGTEFSGGYSGYARQQITFHRAQSNGEGELVVRNAATITFPQANENWGQATEFGIWDASENGNQLAFGSFDPFRWEDIDSGDTFVVKEEQIAVGIGGAWSEYLQQKVLEWVFCGQSFTAPTIYVALYENAPLFEQTGSDLDEPSGGGYARKQHSGASNWQVITGNKTVNSGAVTFNQATANWTKTIYGSALVDAASGGNLLCWGATDHPQGDAINSGDTPQFADSAVELAL